MEHWPFVHWLWGVVPLLVGVLGGILILGLCVVAQMADAYSAAHTQLRGQFGRELDDLKLENARLQAQLWNARRDRRSEEDPTSTTALLSDDELEQAVILGMG